MAPTIRYATALDGTSLALTTLGEGVPLLFMPTVPFSHVEAMWELPGVRDWFEQLSRGAEIAIYDARGTGLSDRSRPDFSIEVMTGDLEAVVERLGWDDFALCGFFNAAAPAIAYAAAHPERVTDLVLWGGFTRGADVYPLALTDDPYLAEMYWGILVDTAARTWTAATGDEARVTADYFRACVEPVSALRAIVAARDYDVSSLLSLVRARTLVVQRRDAPSQRIEVARGLASGIPDAELCVLPGEAASPFSGDIAAGVQAIEAFLGLDVRETIAGSLDLPTGGEHLTAREAEILRLIAHGRANKEIALDLGLSVHTVERHLTNLYPKIGCRSRTEAAAFALTHGLA